MQGSSTTTSRRCPRSVRAFEQYVSGRRELVAGTVFFLESGEHLGDVLRAARRRDIVLAPPGSVRRGDANVIGYRGRFREPGDRLVLDGHHVIELQDYVAAPFLSIVARTVLRQRSAEGVAALLSDADTARDYGIFVDQLLSRAVLLESRMSFTPTPAAAGSVVRVHVTADGEYRDGPDGLLLGRVGDERAEIEAAAVAGAGRGRSFARIVDRRVLEADLDDRPWLGRYLAALDLLRERHGGPGRPTVSGFGGHLVRALDESAAFPIVVSADAPFLVTGEGDEYLVLDPVGHRRLRLGLEAARAAECLIATEDESSATALLAFELGVRPTTVAPRIHEVRNALSSAGFDLPADARGAA
ncbi:daptide biosynthesis RiPP recognition protein [uncultured Microbacterium sp.]|uniref:daptide biosynthesis RiPP recognition protein n=1 Tax=Microbacterium algeriense TaxID=2615184 RepID=UPI00338DB9C9